MKLTFNADQFSVGEPINYEISGADVDQLRAAAAELRAELSRYAGVFDIADSFRAGKQEIKLNLLPEARNLGLTLGDLARQVRNAFYGAEAQRVQRGRDDLRVMVRFLKRSEGPSATWRTCTSAPRTARKCPSTASPSSSWAAATPPFAVPTDNGWST